MRAWLPFLLLPLLAPAAAQEPCSQVEPCAVPLDMDAQSLSFGGEAEFSVTAGDTISFDAFNTDDVDHDISIADLGIAFTVPPFESGGYGPYTMDAPGDYVVTDLHTGLTVTLHVVWDDVSETGGPGGEESPAPAFWATVLLLALVAWRKHASE